MLHDIERNTADMIGRPDGFGRVPTPRLATLNGNDVAPSGAGCNAGYRSKSGLTVEHAVSSKKQCVILIGLPGAGKTTFYEQWFRGTHDHVSKDLWPNERHRDARQRRVLEHALRRGVSVVVDNTNVSRCERQVVIALGREYDAQVIGYFFEVSTREAVAMNARRTGRGKVPNVAIFAAAKRLERPCASEGFDQLFRVCPSPTLTFAISELVTRETMAVSEHAETVQPITREEIKASLDQPLLMVLVEALTPDQFREGHLPGAVNLPPSRVHQLAPTLLPDKHQKIVVYCANAACHASDDVARDLVTMGYDRVSRYPGGKADWRAAGLPIDQG